MKATLTLLALLALPSHAATTDICDRTPEVRDKILKVLGIEDCSAVDLAELNRTLPLHGLMVTSLKAGDFDGLANLRKLTLHGCRLTTLPVGVFDELANLRELTMHGCRLTSLPAGAFDGLESLEVLALHGNQLTTLPMGLFDGVGASGIKPLVLSLGNNRLTTLPVQTFRGQRAGLFDGLNLGALDLCCNRFATLPEGAFEGATLGILNLQQNQLAALPEGLFGGVGGLRELNLQQNRLTTLPEGLFDGVHGLKTLDLRRNQLATLPEGLLDGLGGDPTYDAVLENLYLNHNQLRTLPAGLFNGHTGLRWLYMHDNRLTTLPETIFGMLSGLRGLHLHNNHLVGLTLDDPLFSFRDFQRRNRDYTARVLIYGQTYAGTGEGETEDDATRLVAAVPLMPSPSARQGFARIVNESDEGGVVRVFAIDDGGYSPDPFEIRLEARQAFHFNADDLQGGNDAKGMDGIGAPVQGDWRLDVETALSVRVLAFVRTGDGFLTAMHDVLPRRDDGRLAAMTFNPASNDERVSRLRLVNTGDGEAEVSIEGVDDAGAVAGPVSLTLDAGHSRTLSASELEGGAHGLTGTLGDGRGKWRLRVTAPDAVVAMSLLDAASGHLSNLSTMGAAP